MNVFTVIGIIGLSVALLAVGIARLMYSLSRAVVVAQAELEDEKKKFRPATTMGYRIAPTDPKEAQFKQARDEAAKRAAALPRGGNMGVGQGQPLQTASKVLKQDPIAAFKIAQVQGWTGLGEMDKYQSAGASAPAAATAAAGPRVKKKLVPGKDYPVVEITAGMDPAERRRARILNAKAKSAAMKALKAAGADTVAASAVGGTAAAPKAPKAPQVTAASMGIAEPQLIPITDDMDPAELRKARIANSKAMSAYKKALKAAGVSMDEDGDEGASPAAVATPVEAPSTPSAPSAVADLAGIPKPTLIEITEGMDPNEVRKARIANSKTVSAYKKALKEAGIDPSTVEI